MTAFSGTWGQGAAVALDDALHGLTLCFGACRRPLPDPAEIREQPRQL